jgi:hypothetical protein
MRRCRACQQAPVEGIKPGMPPHPNTKYCAACRTNIRTQPPSGLTEAQAAQIDALRGQITRRAIAATLGVSQAAINRLLRDHQWRSNSHQYAPDVVEAVCQVYDAGGKAAVRARFPEVKVRSIVERYKLYQPRQIRWTDGQIIDAARMAGLVGSKTQAHYFGRPNAYAWSIKSLWDKRFQCPPRDINGLSAHLVWQLATPGIPAVLVRQEKAPRRARCGHQLSTTTAGSGVGRSSKSPTRGTPNISSGAF